MLEVSSEQRRIRMCTDNPWWEGGGIRDDYSSLKPRAYFVCFSHLVTRTDVRRAVVLMGPRRVGKTVLLHHMIGLLLDSDKYTARDIGYASLDQPLYMRLSIEEIADEVQQASKSPNVLKFLFLDEIQYLPDWERHLKVFVDTHPETRCVVSGSAAAALHLKSIESGAGRFTDFLLPPLTFYEYLDLRDITELVKHEILDRQYRERNFAKPHRSSLDTRLTLESHRYTPRNLAELNRHFIDYVNFGGYPEIVASPAIHSDFARDIGTDIVGKVLLHDLPSLYKIQDVQELYTLFTTLAYNTAGEVSLESLSHGSGVTKSTIKRYLEYLEAAFLIKVIHRIDRNARRFKRANCFKVHVTTPALRCALFGPVAEDDPEMGPIAETTAFAQFFHYSLNLHYAHWKGGEVDIVHLDERQKPDWCVDVKWSDRYVERPDELKSLKNFTKQHPDMETLITTRSIEKSNVAWSGKTQLDACPTSMYCFIVGHAPVLHPSADIPWSLIGE